ncbi:MAG: BatA domain-containing protein [Candidatus Eisenbacteria bacterium]|uniref:BatA domain-containing protein n=1 Tax=Eiseniibacteriota bacterium TaxID=2212470 RepID=A0A933SB62_UNCEI|nr:BatA domain-containing protein [Candidatus Eisenbacteria bacterium]
MNFLNPLVLFGLGAAAIPILIHLFTKRRPREVQFSSLEFLSEVHQSEIRRLKLKQWLLLLLRTLAIAALALAMARPAVKGGNGGGAASSLVALVDVSGSMSAPGPDGRPLAAAARRAVEDLLATLGPGDELLLVPYDRAPRPVSDVPLGDAGRLRAAAAALVPTAHVTDHRAALELAARALSEARALNRELFWISDFQRSGFSRGGGAPDVRISEGPWRDVRTYLVPLAPRSRANAALTDARLTPSANGAALDVRARAFGVTPADFAVEARSASEVVGAPQAPGERLGSGFISLGASGESGALLPLTRTPDAGGEALLSEDALALDNRRVFASGRAGALHVLLREDGDPSALRFALEAGGELSGLDVRTVDPAALAAQADGADAIVIGDVERLGPAELQAVLDAWRGGGALLLVPGERADAAWWNETLLKEVQAGTMGALENAPGGSAWRLQLEAAGHPALEGFPARPGEALSAARFLRARALRPAAGARVIARFDGAHAALVEATRALVLATPLDPASSDFATSGAFLPLVHQCARVLARGTAAASLAPGDVWRASAGTGEWRVVGEDGREVPVTLTGAAGGSRLTTAPLEAPGLYRVWQGRQLRGSFAVNPDPAESDLAAADERELMAAFPAGRATVLRAGESLANRVREARYGRELWPLFVAIALLLLAAESLIGRPATGGPGKEKG